MSIDESAGILFCLCGPAGVGKTVLGKRLLEANPNSLQRSISVTSRTARQGEKDGVSYHFVSKQVFQEKIKANALVEWEEVHNQFYGTLRTSLDQALSGKRDVLLIIDINGCLRLKQEYPENCVIIFVAPPTFSDLEARMRGRGEINASELTARLDTARAEFKILADEAAKGNDGRIDYLLVNRELEDCTARLQAVLQSERAKLRRFPKAALNQLLK